MPRKTANNYVQNAFYRHANGKIAQLKHQMSELGFSVVLHVDIFRQCALH